MMKKLLILSSDPRSFMGAEQFLGNREWIVFSTADEKAALNILIEKRPAFFMISVNHPNRKVRTLHRLVMQTFPGLSVIMFGERSDMETFRQLQLTGHPHRIHPPVTGPAIERVAMRLFKDAEEKQHQEELYLKSLRRSMAAEELGIRWSAPEDLNVLARGTDRILDEIVEKGDGIVREKILGPTSNTACIVIESERFSGYLIAAMAGDRAFDDQFIGIIRERLIRYLRENGETVRDGESFPMKVSEVRFEAWAADYAEFLKKTVHQGQEMAFAFFPVADVATTVGASAIADMCTVRIEDLVAGAEVDFNVHLHLPANQRFLLYTPKGAVFFAAQKERLLKSGCRELHIRESDLAAFRRYRARHRIESLIKDFGDRNRLAF